MKHKYLLLVTACITAAFFTLLSPERPALSAGQSVAPPARVAAAPGLVEPASEERTVGSEVIGTLREVPVEENDTVKAGQVIAVVKNDDQTALLAQAAAQLDGAKATLAEAEADFRRKENLTQGKFVSAAERDMSRRNLGVAKAGVAQAEALMRLAQANLDKTLIRSPIDGVVLKRLVVAGMAVSNQPPTPIAVVGDISALRVRAEVDELDIGSLKAGQRVEIKSDAFPGLKAGGTVIRVNKRLGARIVQTDRSNERADSKVLQTLIALDPGVTLPIGLRVDVFFQPAGDKGKE